MQKQAEENGLQKKIFLDPAVSRTKRSTGITTLFSTPNAFLHQMDLIENPSFTDVIVLQTVADEVRHRSLPLFNRLKNLIADPDRRFWVFYNDFGRETAVLQHEDESPNDRNDRAIRTAAKWYRTHLMASTGPAHRQSNLDVLLISDDQDNVQRALNDDIRAMSVRDYIEGLENADQLLDLLASRSMVSGSGGSEKRAVLYPEHLPLRTRSPLVSNRPTFARLLQCQPIQLPRGYRPLWCIYPPHPTCRSRVDEPRCGRRRGSCTDAAQRNSGKLQQRKSSTQMLRSKTTMLKEVTEKEALTMTSKLVLHVKRPPMRKPTPVRHRAVSLNPPPKWLVLSVATGALTSPTSMSTRSTRPRFQVSAHRPSSPHLSTASFHVSASAHAKLRISWVKRSLSHSMLGDPLLATQMATSSARSDKRVQGSRARVAPSRT